MVDEEDRLSVSRVLQPVQRAADVPEIFGGVFVPAPLQGIESVQNNEVEWFRQAEECFLSWVRVDLQPPVGVYDVEPVEILIRNLREIRCRVLQTLSEAPLGAFRKDV